MAVVLENSQDGFCIFPGCLKGFSMAVSISFSQLLDQELIG